MLLLLLLLADLIGRMEVASLPGGAERTLCKGAAPTSNGNHNVHDPRKDGSFTKGGLAGRGRR